jgi:signal peptidase II
MFLLAAAALIAVDQLTKYWAEHTFPLGGAGYPLGLGFHLTYVRNTGAAFGIFQDGTLLLGILSVVVSLGLLVYLILNARTLPRLQLWALTLIFSGAVGNMIDRFRLGYVIDFIHFYLPNFDFPVFNIADSCVVVGAALLIISSLIRPQPKPGQTEQSHDPKSLAEPEFFNQTDR